ncbi:UvrD-like helicase C-terminal domain-containing protein [Salinimicrobium sediminis]|uniref:DNA 3'-5' helicase II n=1 Tax=Salinimicrobium sediminis TaxID=1343891 RepID=A0A285X983_9FLAO|nr:AAA family ATPase [Salinimicrobium sediminis]SOC81566.1 UvrD-like helicase C-terminal domain-containing protein [Salinimicrobium sediminis]
MIYPEFFPEERISEFSEKKVFEKLKRISKKYDVFYSRKFVTDGLGKTPEFEIDFIIALPCEAMVCLEVKGGLINYDGPTDKWTQNGRVMSKKPDSQASAAAHSLAENYSEYLGGMPVGWGICFPDCSVLNLKSLPESIKKQQLIDQDQLHYIEDALPYLMDFVKKQNSHRTGIRKWEYEKFKSRLLRGIGFVQILSTRIKYDEQRFVELTNYQLDLFKRASSNKNIITKGPAGSGKTIVAKTLAQDFISDGKSVLFLCFNRTLANKIRYEFDRDVEGLEVMTFHSFAKNIIEKYDFGWWNENASKNEDFWNLEVPIKLQELAQYSDKKYDILIIDEGQDFKEFWYEIMFDQVRRDGQKFIFLDAMQDIFNHYTSIPKISEFFTYTLPENCRNTRNIVGYLSEQLNGEIKCFEHTPIGSEVVIKEFADTEHQVKFLEYEISNLLRNEKVALDQILLLLNSKKAESSLVDLNKVAGYSLRALDNKARFQKDSINYTTINTFKGLEADIIFIIDINLIDGKNKPEKLYTQASRARHKLYILRLER